MPIEIPAYYDFASTICYVTHRVMHRQAGDLSELGVVLRDIQHLDYHEIAELLDTPLGTVKSRIHAARQAIRPLLRVHDS